MFWQLYKGRTNVDHASSKSANWNGWRMDVEQRFHIHSLICKFCMYIRDLHYLIYILAPHLHGIFQNGVGQDLEEIYENNMNMVWFRWMLAGNHKGIGRKLEGNCKRIGNTAVVIKFKYDENTRGIFCFLHIIYDIKNP